MPTKPAVDPDVLKRFCERHHIRRLSFFGSVVREDFTESSDVDVLVEFEEGQTPGFGFFSIQDELSEILARPVDLHTPASLSRYIRDSVMQEAEPQYVQA